MSPIFDKIFVMKSFFRKIELTDSNGYGYLYGYYDMNMNMNHSSTDSIVSVTRSAYLVCGEKTFNNENEKAFNDSTVNKPAA